MGPHCAGDLASNEGLGKGPRPRPRPLPGESGRLSHTRAGPILGQPLSKRAAGSAREAARVGGAAFRGVLGLDGGAPQAEGQRAPLRPLEGKRGLDRPMWLHQGELGEGWAGPGPVGTPWPGRDRSPSEASGKLREELSGQLPRGHRGCSVQRPGRRRLLASSRQGRGRWLWVGRSGTCWGPRGRGDPSWA